MTTDCSPSFADGIVAFGEGFIAGVTPAAAKPAARSLFDEASGIYRRVLDERCDVAPGQRARVQAAGRAFALAGGAPEEVVEMLGRLATHLVDTIAAQRPQQAVVLVDVAHLLLHDFLAGAIESSSLVGVPQRLRWDLVQRLVLDEGVPEEVEGSPDEDFTVVVVRLAEIAPQARLWALMDDYYRHGMLGAPLEDSAVILVPERSERRLAQLFNDLTATLGQQPWLAISACQREGIASGYREAKDVLALALATGRPPGQYRLDDVLLEYAIIREPTVSRRLVDTIRPLLASEVLCETLEALIQADFNRVAAARSLHIHRSTLDYRIRRIQAISGHNPLTSRGAQLLSAAMAVHAIAESPEHSFRMRSSARLCTSGGKRWLLDGADDY